MKTFLIALALIGFAAGGADAQVNLTLRACVYGINDHVSGPCFKPGNNARFLCRTPPDVMPPVDIHPRANNVARRPVAKHQRFQNIASLRFRAASLRHFPNASVAESSSSEGAVGDRRADCAQKVAR
jgi:hypothetical protein